MSFISVLTLDPEERAVLVEILTETQPEMLSGRSHVCAARAEKLGRAAATRLGRIAQPITKLSEHQGKTGVLIIELGPLCGEDIAALPPTPDTFVTRRHHQLTSMDVIRFALIGAAGGYSYSYNSQANGALGDDVFPVRRYADASGFSGGKDLGWHTEDAAFNRSDDDRRHTVFDVFSFAYFRNPNADPTLVSMPDLGTVDPTMLAELRRRQFVAKTSMSHGGDRHTLTGLTSFMYAGEHMRFSFARIAELRATYRGTGLGKVIDEFKGCLDDAVSEIPGMPGTIAFVDNMRVAHARGTWRRPPRFDGTDRWQRRLGFARSSRQAFLETLMIEPESREIDSGRLMAYLSRLS